MTTIEDPHCRDLLDKVFAIRAWMEICHVTTRFGFPCLLAYLWREDQGAAIVSGAGCHSSPLIALSRAIAEAVQTRLTFIAGSRDDISCSHLHSNYHTLAVPGTQSSGEL
jgi:ribosomal protein S12 methylthiotransferase accessory factor